MKYILLFLKGTLNIIAIIENIICVIGIWLINILVFLSVLNRYLLHFPIMWLNDLALYCFIFFVFLSIALTTRENEHISVGIFREALFKGKPKADTIYSVFLNIIAIISVSFFFLTTVKYTLRAIKYPEYSTLLRWFNTSWLAIVMFFTIIFIIIHLVTLLTKDIGKLIKFNSK